jgi:hypothetical protein
MRHAAGNQRAYSLFTLGVSSRNVFNCGKKKIPVGYWIGPLYSFRKSIPLSIPPTPSVHRLRLGLPGYLILFAPPAFAPQRQLQSRKPPSPLVFLPISTHFTATPGIPLPSPALKHASFERHPPVEPGVFTSDLTRRLRALYAQ